jgi:hypothetical protein
MHNTRMAELRRMHFSKGADGFCRLKVIGLSILAPHARMPLFAFFLSRDLWRLQGPDSH